LRIFGRNRTVWFPVWPKMAQTEPNQTSPTLLRAPASSPSSPAASQEHHTRSSVRGSVGTGQDRSEVLTTSVVLSLDSNYAVHSSTLKLHDALTSKAPRRRSLRPLILSGDTPLVKPRREEGTALKDRGSSNPASGFQKPRSRRGCRGGRSRSKTHDSLHETIAQLRRSLPDVTIIVIPPAAACSRNDISH